MAPRTIVFDLDGTVTNPEHRQHFVRGNPKNWNAFAAGIPLDAPHQDIIWLLKVLKSAGCVILLASGRGEESRVDTMDWLMKHNVPFDALYMRNRNDYRPDDIVKKELLDQMRSDGHDPYMVFDDRDSVVNMWRKNGIRCMQVAPGNF
jgi:hypothetical protein